MLPFWPLLVGVGIGVVLLLHRSSASYATTPVASNDETLVVFFHAWGGRDSTYRPILESLDVPFTFPHGTPMGNGRFRWWEGESNESEAYADGVRLAVERVRPEIEALKSSGKRLLLAGHSQGAQVAATLAMQGIAPAVVAAGWVPAPLVTSDPQPIVFVNGTNDPHAIYARTAALVSDLNAPQVSLVTVDGAGHEFSGALLDAWLAEMRKALQ